MLALGHLVKQSITDPTFWFKKSRLLYNQIIYTPCVAFLGNIYYYCVNNRALSGAALFICKTNYCSFDQENLFTFRQPVRYAYSIKIWRQEVRLSSLAHVLPGISSFIFGSYSHVRITLIIPTIHIVPFPSTLQTLITHALIILTTPMWNKQIYLHFQMGKREL